MSLTQSCLAGGAHLLQAIWTQSQLQIALSCTPAGSQQSSAARQQVLTHASPAQLQLTPWLIAVQSATYAALCLFKQLVTAASAALC